MYDLIRLLLKIGLSDKEAHVYLVTLQIGTNPASIIAKHSELNRCTTYSILESLIKKGMVHEIEKDTVKYFTAVEPRQLAMHIEEKQRDLAYYKNEIISRVSEFDALKHPAQVLTPVKSYSGKNGIKNLYNESLSEPFLFINAREEKKQHQFFTQYANIFLGLRKEIHLSVILGSGVENTRITNKKDLELIPNCSPMEIIGKYKLFIIDEEDEYGIEIRQPRIINEHQKQFRYLWNIKKSSLQ